MKKTSQKIFLKVTAFVLAIVISNFGFFAKACGVPFPKGIYRIYNVAIIGSDVDSGRVIEESPGFNRNVIDGLCKVGAKLENFSEVDILGSDKISFAGRELPRASIVFPEQNAVFCFYDVANLYGPEVIRECPFALCPYTLNPSENYEAWATHMTRLRDFVKAGNELCDLRFLSIINGDYTEEIAKYSERIQQIVCKDLDIYPFQQTLNTFWISTVDPPKNCRSLLNLFVTWGGSRESLLKQHIGKSFPTITYYPEMQPFFFQEGEGHSVSAPPIVSTPVPVVPISTSVMPTSTSIAPRSEFTEESKKKSEQMPSCDDSDRSSSSGIDCDRLYMDCFELRGPQLLAETFEVILVELMNCQYHSREIIEGFKGIRFEKIKSGGGCFRAKFKKFSVDCGKKYSSLEDAYSDIFSNCVVCDSFIKQFKKCDREGVTSDQIVNALRSTDIKFDKNGSATVMSGKVMVAKEETHDSDCLNQ